MTLLVPQLDDLTWAQMMDAIRARIPAASQGLWTLHGPVDPGITLLELYAYLLEQRLYLLDQLPDGAVRGVLGLLGVPPPSPAVPAATVLLLAAAPGAAAPVAVPAGTELARPLDDRQLVVTTEDAVALVPGSVRLVVAGADRTADVLGPDGVLLTPGPVDLVLAVEAGFDPPPDAWLSVLLELDTTAGIAPSWAPDAPPGVPTPGRVGWSVQIAPGRFEPVVGPDLDDGTGGLRRSGVLRLAWPAAWRPSAAGAAGTVVRRLRLDAGQGSWTEPPRLVRLALNAVTARHRRLVRPDGSRLEALDAQLGDWLSLPGQVIDLDGPGGQFEAAGQLMDDPATIELTLTERDGAARPWRATAQLGSHGPSDRVFEIDRVAGCLRFGDGLTGRLPVVAARAAGDPPRLTLSYQTGGGEQGNAGRLDWTCDDLPVLATNPVPLRFGADPETVAQARTRAADDLARPTRAGTVADIREIALTAAGIDVARVGVAVGLHPADPCDPVPGAVTVIVVPAVTGDRTTGEPDVPAPVPDAGALAVVAVALEEARLIGTEMFVRAPRYRRVHVTVTPGIPVADPAGLRARLTAGLRRYLDPLVGGAAGDGWPFGEPVRPSELLGVAQDLAGRSVVIDRVAIGLDGAAAVEACQDLSIGANDLVVLADLTLAAAPSGAVAGGLS